MQPKLRIFIIYLYIREYIEYFVDVVKRKREFCESLCKLKVAKRLLLWYHIFTNKPQDYFVKNI